MGSIDSLIGLAKRAGKVQSGEFCAEKSIKAGRAQLVLLAEDVSGNTAKKFENMCSFYSAVLFHYGTKESLGRCIGQQLRGIVVIEDAGFARAMQKKLKNTIEILNTDKE